MLVLLLLDLPLADARVHPAARGRDHRLRDRQGVIKIFADPGLPVTSISTSLLLVLMFGAGTDYCLLFVSRYVEELHTPEDHHDALLVAVPRAGPAIIASAGTVIFAMLVLIFAELASTRTVGPINAIGILIVMIASITLLPALLAIVGRRGFWPSKRAVFDPDYVAGGGARGRRLALGADRPARHASALDHDRHRRCGVHGRCDRDDAVQGRGLGARRLPELHRGHRGYETLKAADSPRARSARRP